MLRELAIKNAGLVNTLRVAFEPGLCIITGETGAGKSMIIGSIELILGERADARIVRTGEDSAEITAMFETGHIKGLAEFLQQAGIEPEPDGTLLIHRNVSSSGKSRCYVNGRPATVSMIKNIGEHLIDIHSQNQHQSLLKPQFHLNLLDAYAGIDSEKNSYCQSFTAWQTIQNEYTELTTSEQELAQQLDILRFQAHEIQNASLKPNEEQQLKQERDLLENSEEIAESIQKVLQLLDSEDISATASLLTAQSHLNHLKNINSSFEPVYEQLNSALLSLEDVSEQLNRSAEQLDFDPNRLEAIEERLHLIFGLKKKYGTSIEAVLAHLADVEYKLERYENRDEELKQLEAALKQHHDALTKAARRLSRKRKKAAQELKVAIETELNDLGMKNCQFSVDFAAKEPGENGIDTVTFLISPNPGEPLRPLVEIASGGEISRIMLAIKTVFAEKDTIPVLIFDEIDVNIGGETATTVGKKLNALARTHQIICITHLPQVAVEGNAHYVVEKAVDNGRTSTSIARLTQKKRVKEITRMLGGDHTGITTRYAEKILNK